MATVLTTTQTDILGPAAVPAFARDSTNGRLYVIARTASDTLTLYQSTDNGGSWSSYAGFTHTTLGEWSGVVVDKNQYAHLAYRTSQGTEDVLWYRRIYLGNPTSPAWSGAVRVSGGGGNGGVPGAGWQGVDLAVVRNSNGSYAIVVAGARTNGTADYGIWVAGVSYDSTHGIYLNNGIITNNRGWQVTGTAPGRGGVTCEVEHTGDGFTSSTPHVWVTWGRTQLRMVKLAWQGSTVGWQGPSSAITIKSTIPAQDYANGRWDGTQWLMPVISPDDATMVRVYQRNKANTITTSIDTPSHPTGNIRQISISYDNATKNPRVFAVGTSTAVLYYVDYSRSLGTWGTWTSVVATAVLGSTGGEWSVKRGGTSGNAKHDVITAASGSPNTVTHTSQTITSPPQNPTWDVSGQPYINGGAANSSASLQLVWTFSDPDPGQTQGSYALSRQIGAGAVQYWNASGSSWGGTEVQNTSATPSVTLASGWSTATDAIYQYKVKVWDSSNTPSAGYSGPLTLTPSALVNPTITAPTGTPTITTSRVTVTWTVSEQSQYRVRLFAPGSVLKYSSDDIVGTDLTYTVPYDIPNGSSGWQVELRTRNLEGLASTSQLATFNVSFAAPPAPISTYAPSTSTGLIVVSSSANAPVGSQPALVQGDLYRRPATTPALNTNPTMNGNITGWITGAGGTGTLSYSTSQFAPGSSPGAARYVPNAGVPAPSTEMNTQLVIDPTVPLIATGWIRPDTANKPVFIEVNFYTATPTFIGSAILIVSNIVAGAWHYLEVVGDPKGFANVAKASVGMGEINTPTSSDGWYVDNLAMEINNDDPGIRISHGIAFPAVVSDWGAAHGIDYEYRWVAAGANGVVINGPWIN